MWITKLTQRIELLATKNRLVYYFVLLYYRFLVKRETLLAGIGENDRILCIGGGMCPSTAILFHRYTKAKVTVIDNDNHCVSASQCFLRQMGMGDIDVAVSDGACVNCADYTVIHVAMQVSPKCAVVNRIMKNAQNGARVLVRMPKNSLQGLYSNISSQDVRFDRRVKHSFLSNVHNTAVCVVRKEPAGEVFSPLEMAI